MLGLDGLAAYADRAMLARVVDNVVANAVTYNRDGGTVAMTARVAAPSPGAWAPTLVTLLVSDTGPGIPPAAHERVFERFCRLDEARGRHTGGSGLGLAICREVMRALGGTIAVESSSPAGTTIAISLPGRVPLSRDSDMPTPTVRSAPDGLVAEGCSGTPSSR